MLLMVTDGSQCNDVWNTYTCPIYIIHVYVYVLFTLLIWLGCYAHVLFGQLNVSVEAHLVE